MARAAVAGAAITIEGVSQGVATVTVRATDGDGGEAEQSFQVTVPNRGPEAAGTIPARTVSVGETATIDVSPYFRDADGDVLSYAATSSNTGVGGVSVSGSSVAVSALARGVVTVTVTARDPQGLTAQQSFQVTVPNRGPQAAGTIPAQAVSVGEIATIDAAPYFRDADGDVLSYAATSSNTGVGGVSVSGSSVVVSALARGAFTATVTARDPQGLTAHQSFQVTVPNRGPEATGTIPAQTVSVGEAVSVDVAVHFRDPDGDPLSYTAASSDERIATAAVAGAVVTIGGLAQGTATITVTAADTEGSSIQLNFAVTVRQEMAALTISAVDPPVLVEGESATISGSGFSRSLAENQVFVGDLIARITSVAETSLTITVPAADCLPPRQAQLRVVVGGLSDARSIGITPLSREDLELPRDTYRYTDAGDGYLHLPGDATGGDYLIGVVSTSDVPSSLTPVTMTSTMGDPTVVADVSTEVEAPQPHRAVPIGLSPASYRSAPEPASPGTRLSGEEPSFTPSRDWARHTEMMARNVDLIRRLGSATPDLGRVRQTRAMATGDTLTLFADFRRTCTTSGQVRAVVRLVGESTIWLDDISNPSGTFTDSELAELDAFYASHVESVHDGYYGDLSDVDANGRVLILMTKETNKQQGLRGWVWSGDLFPTARCRTSNEREVFFGVVPDPDGVFGQAWTRQRTLESYPSLLTHEIAHLVQYNALVFGSGRNLATWALEGGATLSEQLVAYRVFGHGSRQDMGWSEFRDGLSWYEEWVVDLAHFFGWDSSGDRSGRVEGAPERCSWIGLPQDGNDGPCRGLFRAVYGVPSVLFRYAMDRWGDDYPGGEQALMTHLTQSPRVGYAALEEVSSWPIEQILADFYASLWVDLYRGDADGMASWDLADIWSRLAENRWLVPYTSSSSRLRRDWRVRAGSTFYLRWTPSGPRGPTSLKVTTPGGGPASDYVSVWALRIR